MRNWFILILIIITGNAYSQEVEFTASAPEVVEVGQQFRLIYTMNTQASNFSAPAIDGFSVLAGPSTSQSSNVSIINGKVSQTFEIRYTYIMQANKTGTFTIPSAEITVDKKAYKSNTITIEVIQGGGARQSGQTSQSAQIPADENQGLPGAGNDGELYIKIFVDKVKVHREEHLVATIKLFSRLNVTRLENAKLPSFEGFIAEELEVPPLTSLNRERINDQVYLTGVIKKYILYPQKPGEITIAPFQMDVYYQKQNTRRPRSVFDEFFGSMESEGRKVTSNAVIINVLELPGNKPYNFSGGVGNFNLSATLDNNEVNTNDAITFKVKITGNGNLKYIKPVSINFPADFDVYDPKVVDNIKQTQNGSEGNKTFEYLIIPRHAGEFTIPAFSLSYFDTNSDRYKTESVGPYTIQVRKSEGDTTVTVSNAYNKEDLRFLGQDIRYIKTGDLQLKLIGRFLFGSNQFYMVYLVSVFLFLIVFVVRRKKIKENANIVLVKNKKANKFALKRLKKAAFYMKQGQSGAFNEELAKALWGYISDKLGIPVSKLSKDNARGQMADKKIENEYIDQVLGIIDRCEYARYAPATEELKMDTLYNEAVKIISKLQQRLK